MKGRFSCGAVLFGLLMLTFFFGLQPARAAAATADGKTGLVEKNGSYYYYDKDGVRVRKQWVTIDGYQYYFRKSGKAATGVLKKGSTFYLFNEKGRLKTGKKSRFVTLGKHRYYVDAKGRLTTGWFVVDDHLYYASKKKGWITTKERDGITFNTKKGYAKNTIESRLKKETLKVVNKITDDKMTKKQKLKACWDYICGSGWGYQPWDGTMKSKWQKRCAYDMLSRKRGDCRSWACAFAALANEIGYDSYVIYGYVPKAGGGITTHTWVRINGKYYDPEGQWAGWNPGQYAMASYNAQISVTKIYQFSSY